MLCVENGERLAPLSPGVGAGQGVGVTVRGQKSFSRACVCVRGGDVSEAVDGRGALRVCQCCGGGPGGVQRCLAMSDP